MSKLTKKTLDLVIKTEASKEQLAAMSGKAPENQDQNNKKGNFVKAEPQLISGTKGFRIIGQVHASSDIKSPVIGYVLYNDKKETFTQYTIQQVKSILDTYEFVNAELKNGNICITDCAADKLLQFDSNMQSIMAIPAVYVVERINETIKAGEKSRAQATYKVITWKLQVVRMIEQNFADAARAGKATICNMRVDEDFIAAKNSDALPTYSQDIEYVKLEPVKGPNYKLKYENHARFVNALVEFLDKCVVIEGQGNIKYLAIGTLSYVKRGVRMTSKTASKLEYVFRKEVFPLLKETISRLNNDTFTEDYETMYNKTNKMAASQSVIVYSYVTGKPVEKIITDCPEFILILKTIAAAGILPMLRAKTFLDLPWVKNYGKPYLCCTLSSQGYSGLFAYITDSFCEKNNLPDRVCIRRALRRMPLKEITYLDQTGMLVGCGIMRFRTKFAFRKNGRVTYRSQIMDKEVTSGACKYGIMIWDDPTRTPIYKNGLQPLIDNLKVEHRNEILPMAKHIVTELNMLTSNREIITEKEEHYRCIRALSMTCAMYDYLVNGINTSYQNLAAHMVKAVLESHKAFENYMLKQPTSSLIERLKEVDNENKKTSWKDVVSTAKLTMFIRTGGLVIPYKTRNNDSQKEYPSLIFKRFAWMPNEVQQNMISKDNSLRLLYMLECSAKKNVGTRNKKLKNYNYHHTVAGRVNELMCALVSLNYLLYTDKERTYRGMGGHCYKALAASQFYMLRPWHQNCVNIGSPIIKLTVPTNGTREKAITIKTTHKLW